MIILSYVRFLAACVWKREVVVAFLWAAAANGPAAEARHNMHCAKLRDTKR